MKIKKGVLTLFLVAALSVAQMPAMAADSVEVDIYPVVTEGYVAERGNEYLLTQSAKRTISLNGSVRLGASGSNYGTLTDQMSEFDWEGNGRYNWLSYYLSSASTYLYGQIAGGSFIDFYCNDVYTASEGGSVDVSGTVQFWLKPVDYSVNDGSSVLPYDAEYALYPSRVGLIANGEVYGEPVQSLGEGLFSVNVSIPTDEPVTNLGFRFYYDSALYSYYQDGNTTGKFMLFNIYDDSVVIYNEGESTNGLIHEVIQEVKLIPSTVYNFFFGDDGDSASSAFKSSVESAISSGEAVRDEFSELDKPEPGDIAPDIDQYAPLDQYTAYTDTFGALMENDTIVSLMMVSLGFAFLGYVFFGKRE